MSSKILFIFEGQRTEPQIVNSLQKFFVNENTVVKCVYGAEIYQIYKNISADDDLDTFSLLKERSKSNFEILKDFTRDDFAEIYLFFDYDGHSTIANDDKLIELITFFNEETDKGKLFISYPMVESIKHVENFDNFQHLTHLCDMIKLYKEHISQNALPILINFNKYDYHTWSQLIRVHLMKMNYISFDSYTLPTSIIEQHFILKQQINKYIIPLSTVSVLSAFPIFLLHYYGVSEINKRI